MQRAFRNFYWGFLFVMVDFRLNGLDILPDIIGYAFFIAGLNLLKERNDRFRKARIFHIVMLFLSIFNIFERQVESTEGINFYFNSFEFLIGILILIFTLLAMYNLFMAIKQLAEDYSYTDLSFEADQRWKQFVILQIASSITFLFIFIPILGFAYIFAVLIFAIWLTVKFMGFMTRCGSRFSEE